MRFTTFTSVTILLATAVSAVPAPAPAPTPTDIITRDDQVNNEARDAAAAEDLHLREIDDGELLEARKPKWEKIKVTDSTGSSRGGKLKQNEWPDAEELAQKALYQAGCDSGKITFRWHKEGSQDPKEHLRVSPSGGSGGSKGEIHVYRDGSWTQGPGGKNGKGDGRV